MCASGNGRNRVAVGDVSWLMTQGSRVAATLGFGSESRWDSQRVEFESPHLSSNGAKSISTFVFPGSAALLFQCLIHKLEQRLRRRNVRQAEILVKLAVVGFLGREALGRNARVLQHGLEALRLRARVGMVGHEAFLTFRRYAPAATIRISATPSGYHPTLYGKWAV